MIANIRPFISQALRGCKAIVIIMFYPKSLALDKIFKIYNSTDMEKFEMEPGKIYYLDYGSGTQIVGKFKAEDTCNYLFHDLLHYWNGSETFHSNSSRTYCVKAHLQTIRRASAAEKHALIKEELAHDLM